MKKKKQVSDVVTMSDDVTTDSTNIDSPKRRHKSQVPIILVGLIGLIGVGALTYFASSMVLDNENRNADIAYAESYNDYITDSLNNQSSVINKQEVKGIIPFSGYSSKDLLEVEGEWYIASDLVLTGGGTGNNIPIMVNTEDTIMIGSTEYMHITKSDSKSEVPFVGNEYVVVDIDGSMVYLVKKGDTLSDVSGRVGYSIQELADANKISNVNLIYEGQTLRIPASDEAIEYVKSHSSN